MAEKIQCAEKKRGGRWCSIQGCSSGSVKDPDLQFFRFPKDFERLSIWIEKTKRYDLRLKPELYPYNNCKVCSKHFDESMFHTYGRSGNRRLKSDAIPTKFIFNQSMSSSISRTTPSTSLQINSSNNLASAETNNESQIFVSKQDASIVADIDRESTTISLNTSPTINPVSSEVNFDAHSFSSEQHASIEIDCDSSFSPHLTSTAFRNPSPFSCTISRKRKLSFHVDCSASKKLNHVDNTSTSSSSTNSDADHPSVEVRKNSTLPTSLSPSSLDSSAIPSSVLSSSNSDSDSGIGATPRSDKIFCDAATQTEESLSSNTPRKTKLRQENVINRRQIKYRNKKILKLEAAAKKVENTLAQFDSLCDNFLPKPFSALVQEQARLFRRNDQKPKDKKAKGRRYSMQLKKFALATLYMSPKAYKLLKQIMTLPSVCCLRRMTQKWEIKPGFNDNIFAVLKTKVAAMPQDDRMCVLGADEISLQSNLFYNHTKDEIVGFHDIGMIKSFRTATHALVLMTSGIRQKWKQPLAFFFVSNSCSAFELKEIVETAIKKLAEIGLQVKVYVTDLGSNFTKHAKLLGVTNLDPFFHVGNQKVYYLYDPPHLMKCFRNNLMKYTFEFEGKKAEWRYLVQFYNIDRVLSLRLAPKLTDSHIHPNNFEKMKVRYATQVFSATVASALYTYVALKSISNSAKDLALLLEKGDKLFDVLNSSLFRPKKKFNQPLRKSKDYQVEFLYEMLKFFTDLKVTNEQGEDVKNTFNFIEGFQQSIRGLLDLWSELKSKGFTYLFTRRLSTDCLENFFCLLRSIFGFCRNPTPIQVQRGFKKLFCVNFFTKSLGSNCEEDFNETLAALNNTDFESLNQQNIPDGTSTSTAGYVSKKRKAVDDLGDLVEDDNLEERLVSRTLEEAIPEKKEFKVGCKDYTNIKLPFENGLSYVSGYLLDKCLELHSCDTCVAYAKECKILTQNNFFTHFKAYNVKYSTFGNLNTPEEKFLCFVYFMEETILEKFNFYALENPASKFIHHIDGYNYQHPCSEFPYDYLVDLYVRFRIFHILKDNNLAFKAKVKAKEDQKLKQSDPEPDENRDPNKPTLKAPPRKMKKKRNQKVLNVKHI